VRLVGAFCIFELERRARLIRRTIRSTLKALREARPQSRPKDADNHIHLRRWLNLFLEARRCPCRLVLPQHRRQLHTAAEFSLEPLDYTTGNDPLLTYIARGRNKNTKWFKHGAPRALSTYSISTVVCGRDKDTCCTDNHPAIASGVVCAWKASIYQKMPAASP
jgi:hypothetical protein